MQSLPAQDSLERRLAKRDLVYHGQQEDVFLASPQTFERERASERERERERESDRQRDRVTERQKDGETERPRDRETERQP